MKSRCSRVIRAIGWWTMETAGSGSWPTRYLQAPTRSWADETMALHQAIQRVPLVGSRLHIPPPPPAASPPERLLPLIEALAPAHLMFDARAVHYGHRYRSGFWAIYL